MGYVTGKTIKELREKRKMTQKELAEIIGVSDKAVSKWETGKGLSDVVRFPTVGLCYWIWSLKNAMRII